MRPETTFGVLVLHVLFFELRTVHGQDTKFATDCMTPNRVQGLCVEIRNCKKLLEQVIQGNAETFDFIRASRCGPANEDASRPKVCCGPDVNYVNENEKVTSKTDMELPEPSEEHALVNSTTTTVAPPAGHSVLPRICGKQKIFLERKIFGGQEADIGEFPWLARLIHINRYNRTGLGCSGFLIHRRFVLTAAHCLVGQGMQHLGPLDHVLLGVHNDTKARLCVDQICTDPPRSVGTLKQVVHALYDSNTHNHDIALIALKEKVPFTDFIKAICLPRSTTNSSWFVISGWGRTESDTSSRTKLKVELPKADRTTCSAKYRTIGLSITEAQICAGGERGHDSCSGDSGGPLMALGDANLWYAEGIVSYGNSCGREGWPGVYTYIPKYYDWIVDQIKKVMKEYDMGR